MGKTLSLESLKKDRSFWKLGFHSREQSEGMEGGQTPAGLGRVWVWVWVHVCVCVLFRRGADCVSQASPVLLLLSAWSNHVPRLQQHSQSPPSPCGGGPRVWQRRRWKGQP